MTERMFAYGSDGIVPTSAAFPLHPNQMGEANMARQVLARLAAG
jgi:hypothetical protein